MSQLSIQRLAPQDKAEFLQMSRAFYASDAVLHPIPDAYHECAFDELMRSNAYMDCFLLKAEGETAGFALLSKTFSREAGGMVVWVEELFILPAFQGRGFGSAFFAWMEQHVPAERYRLEVAPENARVVKLYERLGYEPLAYLQLVKD